MSETHSSPTFSQTTDRGWHETRPWHPCDDVLRRHGFRIAARPRSGPVRWERGGVLYAEAAARLVCDAEAEARGES